MENWIYFFCGLFIFFLNTIVVMLLWNMLMPYLFNVPSISFLQSIGLYILCSTLIGKPIFRLTPPKKQ